MMYHYIKFYINNHDNAFYRIYVKKYESCDPYECSSLRIMIHGICYEAFGHSIFNISHINPKVKNTTYVM